MQGNEDGRFSRPLKLEKIPLQQVLAEEELRLPYVPVSYTHLKGEASADVAIQYNDGFSEFILSFANDVHTPEGGMHETGFKAALTRALNAYGIKIGAMKGDDRVQGEDCREGITAIISCLLYTSSDTLPT